MKNNPFKQKRKKLTTEQIADITRDAERAKDRKVFARDIFFPAILSTEVNCFEAMKACETIASVIVKKMNQEWGNKPVGDLNLEEELLKDKGLTDHSKELFTKLLGAVKDQKIGDANFHLQNMSFSIDAYIRRVLVKKPVKEVDINEFING